MPQPHAFRVLRKHYITSKYEYYVQVVQLDTSAADAVGFVAFILPKFSIPIAFCII